MILGGSGRDLYAILSGALREATESVADAEDATRVLEADQDDLWV